MTPTNTTYGAFSSSNEGLVPIAKSGTTNYATSAYVLTGAGWQAGTKYNTDTDTTYAAFSSSNSGLVPAAKNGTTNYATSAYVLTGAGWQAGTKYHTDTNTTYAAVKASTSNANGTAGLVPTPNSAWFSSGAQDPSLIYLAGTGSWKWTNTFISDNLTDTSTYKALSARMGKSLSDKINLIGDAVNMAWTSYTATTTWTKQTSKTLALTAGTWLIYTYARNGNAANTFQVSMGTTAYNAGNNNGSIVTVPRKIDGRDGQGASMFLITLTAEKVKKEKESDIEYHIGTMIEIPRAALTADEIAEEAEFFSFGTNDLTQMTFGFSRDDAGKFLGSYYENKIYEQDPFAKLDQHGVGKLVKMAVELGKKTRPEIKLGICGEHGGDPQSVEFCHETGLTYVSCSPFRVPIARLAAAQAAIKAKNNK